MSIPAKRKLLADYRTFNQDAAGLGVLFKPEQDNMMNCEAIIFGPDDTEWESGVFRLRMEFSDKYPSEPPKVRFLTTMFHPNIYANGNICLDILGKAWTRAYGCLTVLTSIQSLLTDPNPESPANNEAAGLFTEADGDRNAEYYRRVRQCVEDSWVYTRP